MSGLKFSICIPTYNGALWIGETLKSIFVQDFKDYEIIISDDNSTDGTIKVIERFRDERLKIFKNEKNLGYGKNLQILKRLAKGDILFLMGQDDILAKNALSMTYNAFLLDENIGVVTRPYYWFDEDVRKPVRAVTPYNENEDSIISVFDGEKEIHKIFESVGQLSGLAYKKEYMDIDFHDETFPAHIYPFASITKKHKVVFLKDYTVAVRIVSSQTRFKSSIYDISPTESWVKMFRSIYNSDKYKTIREAGIKQISTHFEGLIQLKTYSTMKNLIREIFILVKLRPANLFDMKFYFFSIGTILIPGRPLRWLVDNYKTKILSARLKNISIEI